MNASQMITAVFEGLTSREREVLSGRFGIEKGGEPQTLAALGIHYRVTRERIRQIQAGALAIARKRIEANASIAGFLEKARTHLADAGGVMAKDPFIAHAQSAIPGVTANHVSLLVEASAAFLECAEDRKRRSFYALDEKSRKAAFAFLGAWVEFLRGKKAKILAGEYHAHLADFIKKKGLDEDHAKRYLEITKEIGVNAYGDMGLAEWPEVKPKTIRDRIYLVLKKSGEPLHFRTIARAINEVKAYSRKASAPTVHNELIKDTRFVLVGRGMYGLAEHGYEPGTAQEVISRILGKHGPLTPRQVILAVQKERFFKPNTILVNLQNKAHFSRLDDGTYHVRQA